jgi:hypothetical protein
LGSGFTFALCHLAELFLKVVEHPCQQCHSAVLDSSAFCSNCGAPQIRFTPSVHMAVPIAVVAGSAPPIARVGAPVALHDRTVVSDRRAAFRAVMNAGAVAALLSAVPVGGSFIFALPLAGFLCVLLYRRHQTAREPTPSMGFRLGVGAGLAGFVILMILTTISAVGFHGQNELRDAMLQAVRQAQTRYSDPQMRLSLEYFMTPQGLVFLMVFGSALMCLLFALLAGLGGAVSASLLRRKPPPQ